MAWLLPGTRPIAFWLALIVLLPWREEGLMSVTRRPFRASRKAAPMKTLLVLMVACGAVDAGAQSKPYPYDAVSTVVLPRGDVQAGRKAFQDLKCHVCHLVSGESGFAAPIAELRGPDLNAVLQLQETSDIAAAIIAPSHSLSIRTSEAVKAQLAKQGASPMGDFTRAMTVRQLADLLSYLRSVR